MRLLIPLVAAAATTAGFLHAAPPTIDFFRAATPAVRVGQSVTMEWNVSGADHLTLRPQVGTVTGTSATVTVAGTTVFTLTASNVDGTTSARFKVYDVDQPTPFTDTVLAAAERTQILGSIFELTWDGTLLREIPLKPTQPAGMLSVFDVAVDEDGRLLASVSRHLGSSIDHGLMVRPASGGTWDYHPVPGLYIFDAAGGDLTVAGRTAYYGSYRINLETFASSRVTDRVPETVRTRDGLLHAGARLASPATSIPYFDPLTGNELGDYSLAGVDWPEGEAPAIDPRAIDVTPDGTRFVGTFNGFIHRLTGQPARREASVAAVLPGNPRPSTILDVSVAPDGRVLAGLRGSAGRSGLLMTEASLASSRTQVLTGGPALLSAYSAFTTTGLLKPRIDYFRASDASVAAGSPVELCWAVGGATEVRLTGVDAPLPPSGALLLPITASGTFTLQATNEHGTTAQSILVLVAEPPRITRFEVTPSAVPLGQNTTASWTVEGADHVRIAPGFGSRSPKSGELTFPVGQDLILTLTAENESGRSRREISVATTPPAAHPVFLDLIPMGASWSWFHPLNGVDPVVTDLDFHSTWMVPPTYDGPAFSPPQPGMLGYGSLDWGSLATDIGLPPTRSRYTAYFVRPFVVPHGASEITAFARIDDGAVVYVDGREQGRLNYAGPDTYRGTAITFVSESDTTPLSLGSIAPGTHWLGVSVHNASNDSSDLAFDFRLAAWLKWYGLPLLPAGERRVTFTNAPPGAIVQANGSSPTDELGWRSWPLFGGQGGGVLELNGRVFHVSSGGSQLVTESVDIHGTMDLRAHVDVRVFQTGTPNGFETDDRIEAWVEGSHDGVNFSHAADLIPARSGNDLSAWDGGVNGPWFHYTTAPGSLSPGWRSLRLVISATNDESNEHFVFDSLRLECTPAPADADADGLSDSWEYSYFGSLDASATGDPDGDGTTNAEEALAATHPLQQNSRLAIVDFVPPSDTRTGRLAWTSVLGRRYTIESSEDLVRWTPLDQGIPAESTVTEAPLPASTRPATEAWRVRITP
jgi:hypothetical protein